MTTTSTMSRRTLVASAAALPALAVPAVASAVPARAVPEASPDAKLQELWTTYERQVTEYLEAWERYQPARAAYDAEVPPCPEDILPGHHFEAMRSLWLKHDLDALSDGWNDALDATYKTIDAIRAIPPQGLLGVGVKIAAVKYIGDPMYGVDNDEYAKSIAIALGDINRLLGTAFTIVDDEESETDEV